MLITNLQSYKGTTNMKLLAH